MKLVELGFFERKLRSLLLKLLAQVENNNNCDRNTNGELVFLRSTLEDCRWLGLSKVVVFDVGANVGHYTRDVLEIADALALSVEVHLFEPMRSSFERLQEAFAHRQDVVLNNFGASEAGGTGTIYFDDATSPLASISKRAVMVSPQSATIQLAPLSEYIDRHGISRIDLLKLDVEGHEVSVLRGLSAYLNPSHIRSIQFEYGGANIDSNTTLQELFTLLEMSGFQVAKVMPTRLQSRRFESWMENFQYQNYVALSPEYARRRT